MERIGTNLLLIPWLKWFFIIIHLNQKNASLMATLSLVFSDLLYIYRLFRFYSIDFFTSQFVVLLTESSLEDFGWKIDLLLLLYWQPDHGSLLQYGGLFRYTPYKGFFGNDSFNYTISDVNGNLATGAVHISVLSIPPQFVSFPSQLQAIEDMISPRFG